MSGQTVDSAEIDRNLLARIRDGDASSLGAFYDRHNPIAFRVAMSIVDDRARAEDVVHDAFLSVWREGSSYTPAQGSVRAWLIGIVHDRAIELRARRVGTADGESSDNNGRAGFPTGRRAAELGAATPNPPSGLSLPL